MKYVLFFSLLSLNVSASDLDCIKGKWKLDNNTWAQYYKQLPAKVTIKKIVGEMIGTFSGNTAKFSFKNFKAFVEMQQGAMPINSEVTITGDADSSFKLDESKKIMSVKTTDNKIKMSAIIKMGEQEFPMPGLDKLNQNDYTGDFKYSCNAKIFTFYKTIDTEGKKQEIKHTFNRIN